MPLPFLAGLPWKLIARIAVPVVLAVVCFGTGFKVANWRRDSLELAVVEAAEKGAVASRAAAVAAVQKFQPKFVTINRTVERETRIEPRYLSADCSHTDAVWLQISAAYEALGYPPLDRAGVPEPTAPSR